MKTARPWTADDDATLRALLPTDPLEAIALRLGRTEGAVAQRRRKLLGRTRQSDATPLTAAQATLVAAHVAWADAGARKYAHRWRRFVTEDDLRSAAYLGLVMAARKFDPARRLSFKTLAMPYCESTMRREVDRVRQRDGAVYDYRLEGHMRPVAQRVFVEPASLPALARLDAPQHDVVAARQQAQLLDVHVRTPAERRLVAALRRSDSHREAAALLGVTPRTVAMRVDRLIERVQARLGIARAA